jgi:hypothetical protein
MVMNLQWCISSFFNRQVVLIRTRSMLYFEVRLSKEKGETFALNYLSLTLMDVFQLNDGNQLTCCTMSWLLLKLNLPILIISKCPLLACLFFLSFHSFLYILIVCTLHCYSYTIDQLREFKRERCTEITTKKDVNVVEVCGTSSERGEGKWNWWREFLPWRWC